MIRQLVILVLVIVYCMGVSGQDRYRGDGSNIEARPDEVLGSPSNGLIPIILSDMPDGNVRLSIDFLTQSNLVGGNWLKVANKVGARVSLWETNGIEISIKDSSAQAAWKLPSKSTVSNVMEGIPTSKRAGQWWSPSWPGEQLTAYDFVLAPLLGAPATNDVIVDLVPLMYKTSTNSLSVQLIEFPAIYFRVKPNGDIEKLQMNFPRQP